MTNKQDFYCIAGGVINLIANVQKELTPKEVKKEMAKILDISLAKLKRYEQGIEEISLYEFFILCQIYNFPFFATKDVISDSDEALSKIYDEMGS